VFRWGTYHGCCSLVEAELELWLKSGYELQAPTVTLCTNVYGVYCEQVTKLHGGRELRLSWSAPSGGFVILTVWRPVETCRTRSDCRGHRMCGKFGTNYRPDFSCSWTLCRAWLCFSTTSSHKVHFDTGTLRITLVSITCRWLCMLSTIMHICG
jgi:hypothetical protein